MLPSNYRVQLVDTIPKYLLSISQLNNHKEFAIDTETYVLPQYKSQYEAFDVHNSSISTFQILAKDTDTVYVFDFITLERLGFDRNLFFGEVLNRANVLLAHNASFEAKFIKKYFGVLLHNFWCTGVASQLINNAFSSKFAKAASGNSLEDLCRDYLSVKLVGKNTVRKEDWYPRPLSLEQVEYAATDVVYLFQLKEILEQVICTPFPDPSNYTIGDDTWGLGMEEILDIEMQFVSVEAECEYNGLPVNTALIETFEDTLGDKNTESGYLLKLGGELADSLGLVTYIPMGADADYPIPAPKVMSTFNSPGGLTELIKKHIGPTDSAEAKIVTRIMELIDLLHNTESNGDTPFYSKDEEEAYKELIHLTDEEVYQRSRKAELLIKYKQYFKQAGMKLSKYVNYTTKRIHYNLNSLGAATGRCSSSKPNSQNINAKVHLPLVFDVEVSIDNIFSGDSIPACKL